MTAPATTATTATPKVAPTPAQKARLDADAATIHGKMLKIAARGPKDDKGRWRWEIDQGFGANDPEIIESYLLHQQKKGEFCAVPPYIAEAAESIRRMRAAKRGALV